MIIYIPMNYNSNSNKLTSNDVNLINLFSVRNNLALKSGAFFHYYNDHYRKSKLDFYDITPSPQIFIVYA